jgi:D-glycero-alpha-D-manno-heptose-7-phosphate kinase
MIVRARSWCRVDLAGGTLDLWPLGLLHPDSCTVNVAIDLPVTVTLRRRREGYELIQDGRRLAAASLEELARSEDGRLVGLVSGFLELPPCEIELASGSPRGGGLGASSALVVAFLAAGRALLEHPAADAHQLAAAARDLEAQLMGLPTGIQDHYPGLLGGALRLTYLPGGHRVATLATDLEALGDSLIVAYSGQSHFSAGANWQIVRRRLEAEPETTELLGGIGRVAGELSRALAAGDLPVVGRLLSEEWSQRRRLADGISTSRLEELLSAGLAAGAWGGKACGAGGGGSLALLAPPEARPAVVSALESLGAEVIETRPTTRSLEVRVE